MFLENNHYPSDVRVRREAESLVSAGYIVRVVAPRGRGQARRERVAGVEVRRFRLPQGTGAVSLALEYMVAAVMLHAAALRELAAGAYVVHLHNPPDVLFAIGGLARGLGRRVVFDHHDLFPELVAEKLGAGPWVRIARGAERATFAVANVVLSANESHARVARDRGRKQADAVHVVRNGPPAASLVTGPVTRPGTLHDPRLVYVGALSSQDGVVALAEVMSLLVHRHRLPDARLEVVGDGDARGALAAALRRAGVNDRVTFTGWLSPAEVPERIQCADVCLDPAPASPLNHQSTMIKIAEYMAAGKPVVAGDLLETRRTLGDAGVLVAGSAPAALAAAIATLAADAPRRADLGARALERARLLTWERSGEALLRAYDTL